MDQFQKLQLLSLAITLQITVWCAIVRIGVLGWAVALAGVVWAATMWPSTPLARIVSLTGAAIWLISLVALMFTVFERRRRGLINPRQALTAALFMVSSQLLTAAALWADIALTMAARSR